MTTVDPLRDAQVRDRVSENARHGDETSKSTETIKPREKGWMVGTVHVA